MFLINKKTIDKIENDALIMIKKDFEESLKNKELNDIQRSELKEMIEYVETRIINNQIQQKHTDNN